VLISMSARVTIVVLACMVSASALALADTERSVNVQPGSLVEGLESLAKQCGVDVIYPSNELKGLKTRGVSGTLEPEAAFRQLIEGTPLILKKQGSALLITLPGASTRAASKDAPGADGADTGSQEGKKDSSGEFRVAQVDQGQASGPHTVEEQDEQSYKKKPVQLEEVVVTGSRIPLTAGQEVQPVHSYKREDIEVSGQTTIGEFLNTLPDVSTFANSPFQLGFVGAQTVQLHGLPIGTTLTLLDGRRLETSIGGFFDLSNIPLAAVERIEILPVGASAIYGADGLGGAVNTILRKNFNGFEANATLEHARGVNDPSANLAWGKSWERGSISLIGSYQERGELLGTQRAPWSLSNFPENFPASVLASLTGCAPGNVYSVDGSNLSGLSSPEAAIPGGITGVPTLQQFAAAAGKQNLCSAERYADITPRSQREGALFSAHYNIGQSIDLFTEVLLSHQYRRDQNGPQIQVFQGTVAADNPYNPFGEAVNVSFSYPGAGLVEDESTSLIRPIIGVRGSVLSDWHYEATVYLSQDRLHDLEFYSDYQKISAALLSSSPTTALNPFTSSGPGTPQLLTSLIDPAVDKSEFSYKDRIVSGQGFLRGPVLQLPEGTVQAVIGGEYSRQNQDTLSVFSPPTLLHRNTYALFSEARIPVLAGGEGERLALTLAGRYDHSNDYGGKATWQSGLLWRATDTLSLRGGYGQSYQAPQLSQISGPQSVFNEPPGFGLPLPDPFRGNQPILYPVAQVFGPNYNLKPETGDSFTLGLEYSSQALPGLHGSLTWYDVNITNYISTEAPATLVDNPNLFPGAVIRAPPTAQDQQLGFLGVITQLNEIFYNFGKIHVSGFDADIRYAIDTRAGQFTPSVSLANVYKWQSALLPGTPEIDAVGKAQNSALGGGVGWSPRWRGTAGLAWKQGPLSTYLAGRYIGRYLDDQEFVPNTHEIGNTWMFDFNARYEAGQAWASTKPWLAGAYVALGAVNLLNKTPPLTYTSYLYDIQEYDIRGRYLHLNVGLRF
jgi:iron complex outermembrane receptor protein